MADLSKFDPRPRLKAGLEQAIEVQHPLAVKNVARLRRVHPDKTPQELILFLTRVYLAAVAATGAATGAASASKGTDVKVRLAASFGDQFVILEASVLYVLSVAEVHGLDVEDDERRRLLVISVLVGNRAATATLEPLVGRTAPHWGRQIVKAIPMSSIDKANVVLGHRFITKYGTKQGVLVLGKQAPRLIGAGIGGVGNGAFGCFTVKAARKLLGPPPESWDTVGL